ncbi:hypothetical protein FQN55_000061 [Onygenales sp. PD_40]|nr:hypothetical protein FQN55_000061 [Onygenales sp. PD_40]
MPNIHITIVSDTVCPWCYIGKKRLERAISLYHAAHPSTTPTDTFTTDWRPFYLNPDPTRLGVDKTANMVARFGAERTHMIQSRLAAAGAAEGISFKFGGKTGYTRDSHRVIQLGKERGGGRLQTRVVEELFKAYFENERDISDRGVLVEAAVGAGLEEGDVRGWLEGEGGGETVDREVRESVRRGISGVPYFMVQGGHRVEGAEGPEAFLEVFERVRAAVGEEEGEDV